VSSFVAVAHLGSFLIRPLSTMSQRGHRAASRPAFTVPPQA
jgi:hypothetical protein